MKNNDSKSIAPKTLLPKCPTGIQGLDEITGGGLPRGRPTLVCGGAGCGKTLLAAVFLVRGAVLFGEPGVFLTFEETEAELRANVASLGFDLAGLVRGKKIALDYVHMEPSEVQESGGEKKGNFFPSIWEPPVTEKLPYEFGSIYDWDGWLLQKCMNNIDNLSEHTYAYPNLAFDAEKQVYVDVQDPLPHRARRLANRIGGAFDCWNRYVEKMPWLKETNIKFIFDEWGNRDRSANAQNQPLPGMLGPLSYALCLHEMFRHSDKITASCATGGLRLLTDIRSEE